MGSKKPNKKVPQTHRKKSKKSAVGFFVIFTLMCLSVLAALSFTVLFTTKSVTVVGNTIYSNEQIISASGISVGKNMFVSMFYGAADNIERTLPYIGKARIERNLNGNVVINVEPTVSARCYKVDEGYLLTDAEGKVLETVAVAPVDKPIISGINLANKVNGTVVTYTDDRSLPLLNDVFAAAEDNALVVTGVNTDAAYSYLDVIIENKYLVHLLNGDNIDYKLLHIKTSLAHLDGEQGGTFTFSESNEGKAIFAAGDIFPKDDAEDTENDENIGETDGE